MTTDVDRLARLTSSVLARRGRAAVRGVHDQGGADIALLFQRGALQRRGQLMRLAEFYARRLAAGTGLRHAVRTCLQGHHAGAAVAVELSSAAATSVCLQPKGGKRSRRGRKRGGRPFRGRVLIVDDVISAGASKESIEVIRAKATTAGVLVALDRREGGSRRPVGTVGREISSGTRPAGVRDRDARRPSGYLAESGSSDLRTSGAVQPIASNMGSEFWSGRERSRTAACSPGDRAVPGRWLGGRTQGRQHLHLRIRGATV